jgi:hypothetical protein
MKFEWAFSISGDQKDLEISLNGGVNVLLEIEHEKFYQYLSEKMAEIWYFQHTLGRKTKLVNVRAIQTALQIKNPQAYL